MAERTASASGRGTTTLLISVAAAVISAVGSLYYLASVMLTPLWILVLVSSLRLRRDPAHGRSGRAAFAVAFATAAVLMPVVGVASFAVYTMLGLATTAGGSTASASRFLTAVHAPVAAAFVIPLIVAWVTSHRDGSEAGPPT